MKWTKSILRSFPVLLCAALVSAQPQPQPAQGQQRDVQFRVGVGQVGPGQAGPGPVAIGGAPGAAAEQETDPATLSGVVLSAAGEPLDKATVSLFPGALPPMAIRGRFPNQASATTDAEGKFEFPNVTPGRYQLVAERAGFVTQSYGARTPNAAGTPLNVTSGDEVRDIEVQLQPQAVVAGQLLDIDGDPILGMAMVAYQVGYQGGRRQLVNAGSDTTDDEGRYRIPGLAPGRYYIAADLNPSGGFGPGAPPPSSQPTEPQETANVTTFYPNALDWETAVPLNLAAGQQLLGTNFVMRHERVYSIRGVLVDQATSLPVAGARIMKLPENGEATASLLNWYSQSAADGSFEIHNILPGTYTLAATLGSTIAISSGNFAMVTRTDSGPDPERNLTGQAVIQVAAQDTNDVVMEMTAGSTITGRVVVEDGELDSLIEAPPEDSPRGLPLIGGRGLSIRVSPTQGVGLNLPQARIQQDGSFFMEGLGPGRYYVTANIPPGQDLYVKSMRLGPQDISKATLDLYAGGGELTITLAKGAGTVRGTLVNEDGELLRGMQVSLWPATFNLSRADNGVRVVTTDQNGSFEFSRLEPGEYLAAAWELLPDPGLAEYPEFLRRFASVAEEVDLDTSGDQSISLELVPADRAAEVVAELP